MARKQLIVTLEDISAAERVRRRESRRYGEEGEIGEIRDSDLGSEGPRHAVTDTGDARVVK